MGTHEDPSAASTISWRAGWHLLWVIIQPGRGHFREMWVLALGRPLCHGVSLGDPEEEAKSLALPNSFQLQLEGADRKPPSPS